MPAFRYWSLTVYKPEGRDSLWRADFNDGTPSLHGWPAIFRYVADWGWEIVSAVPERYDTYHPSEQGSQYVTRYRIFCKQPAND